MNSATEILILGTVGRERVTCLGNVSPIVFGGTGFYATEAVLRPYPIAPLLVSPLGTDLSPAELAGQFSREIRVQGLRQNGSLPSFYWEASYDRDFDQSITHKLENRLLDEFHPDFAALHDEFPQIRSCYLAAFDPRVQLACSEEFSDTLIVSETLQYWIHRDRSGVLDVAKQSSGFIVTEHEFQSIWGFEISPYTPLRSVAHILEAVDLECLIITFADRGSQVVGKEGTFFVPALRCQAVDATGAGNAYAGGFISQLAQTPVHQMSQLVDAAALGTALASLQVQDFSNRALRDASVAHILALQQEVRTSITWFDPE